MSSTCTCGCCEGLATAVPQNTTNRPGLPTLAFRIGTHATFLETMIARLSSHDYPALAALKTRDPADPAIALLDSWAAVADVLTFYQERIANEGYLRTAGERRSILELARLIGYKLRPGVAATVYLAYTLAQDLSKTPPIPTETLIPAGSRTQSVPGPGQLPQPFETSLDLDARSAWNTLQPRLTEPQLFTLNPTTDSSFDLGTDATTRDTVYFSGNATNLKPGDPLLFVLGPGTGQQALRLVQSIELQNTQNRTEVILQPPLLSPPLAGESVYAVAQTALQPYVSDASSLFSGSSLASQVSALLSHPAPGTPPGLLDNLLAATGLTGSTAAAWVQSVSDQVTPLHDLALKRNFTRLEPWLAQLLETLGNLVTQLQGWDATAALVLRAATAAPGTPVMGDKGSPLLAKLTALLPSLAAPPSLQPPNSLQLARSIRGTFSNQSDMAPRLLGAFVPAAAPMLYRAWSNLALPSAATSVGAARIKTGLFPGNYPGLPTTTKANDGTVTTTFGNAPTIAMDWIGPAYLRQAGSLPLANILLDSVNDKIVAGSWIVVDRPDLGTAAELQAHFHVLNPFQTRIQTFHRVTAISAVSRTTADGGFTAKVSQLTLDPPWLSDLNAGRMLSYVGQAAALTGTVVYVQTEMLDLAEEPLDVDLEGDVIELANAYDGLESGRWIIVSGERTDIPNVTGVTASELVMILGVAQVTSSPNGQTSAVHTRLTLANSLAYTYDITTVTIYGNVVKATHGQTNNEILGNGDGSKSFQQFTLKQTPLTFVPASNPAGTDTTLEVYVNNVRWQETDTLAGLGPKDRDYVTQTADDDRTTLSFGNGQEGARAPTGNGNVTAVYRNGIGQPGNVDAGQVSLLQTRPLNVKAVINPLRASGGADRDTRDQARRNAPLTVMALDRLVSVQDYADFARTFAGIGKASSSRLSDGHRDLVYVTIAGAEDIPIDATSDLYTNLVQALQINGDPYVPIVVAIRRLKLLVISAHVKIQPDYLWEPVAAAVRATLVDAFSFDNRNLGQPVFQSEVISAIQAVAGVTFVDMQIMDSVAESVTAVQLAGLATTLRLRNAIPAALAGPNPNPLNPPADSILAAELVCLNSAIPDTLILNEVKS